MNKTKSVHEATFIGNSFVNDSSKKYADGNLIVVFRDMVPPNDKATFHTHNFFEFDIVVDGYGKNLSPNGDTEIKPGTLIFETPASMHSFALEKGDSFKLINVEFIGEYEKLVLNAFNTFEEFTVNLTESELAFVCGELNGIISHSNMEMSELFAKGSVEKVVACVCEAAKRCGLSLACGERDKNVIDALLYIRKHYSERLKLEDVASHVGFSPGYLGKLIKKSTGKSFMRYLLNLRLNNAFNLLYCSDMSIKEVCVEVGYSEYANFFYAFKKCFGITPGEVGKLSKNISYNKFINRKK